MIRGHTQKERSKIEKDMTGMLRASFGKNYIAEKKSIRRNAFRDWRKESGQGDASFRRFVKSKALESAKK